jgi:hypothetical protein
MRHSFSKRFSQVFLCCLLAGLFAAPVAAQNSEQAESEIKVPILKQLGMKGRFGIREMNRVIEEAAFKDLLSRKENENLKQLDVNFSTQTLIAVMVYGDCFVRSSVSVTRDDTAKKYLCRVTKIYGGCRASGQYQNWFVIEKLRPEYTLEFIEMKTENKWLIKDK